MCINGLGVRRINVFGAWGWELLVRSFAFNFSLLSLLNGIWGSQCQAQLRAGDF